jgi:hypothetical protein
MSDLHPALTDLAASGDADALDLAVLDAWRHLASSGDENSTHTATVTVAADGTVTTTFTTTTTTKGY